MHIMEYTTNISYMHWYLQLPWVVWPEVNIQYKNVIRGKVKYWEKNEIAHSLQQKLHNKRLF